MIYQRRVQRSCNIGTVLGYPGPAGEISGPSAPPDSQAFADPSKGAGAPRNERLVHG